VREKGRMQVNEKQEFDAIREELESLKDRIAETADLLVTYRDQITRLNAKLDRVMENREG
jgi:uncharacterized coiled-coil DUF342 family protein